MYTSTNLQEQVLNPSVLRYESKYECVALLELIDEQLSSAPFKRWNYIVYVWWQHFLATAAMSSITRRRCLGKVSPLEVSATKLHPSIS